jgi:hypothetical protein
MVAFVVSGLRVRTGDVPGRECILVDNLVFLQRVS